MQVYCKEYVVCCQSHSGLIDSLLGMNDIQACSFHLDVYFPNMLVFVEF